MANLKTSNIRANVPPKTLLGEINTRVDYGGWEFAHGNEDRWWSGGSSPRPNRWLFEVSIEEVNHGSHLTREPFEYNGLDVNVGDFIADPNGRVLKIVAIEFKSKATVHIVGEDYIRYNTFNSTTGVGRLAEGPCLIFGVNEFIQPMFSTMPDMFAFTSFYSRLDSFFRYLNPTENFLLRKDNHGFIEGDILSIESTGEMALTNDTNSSRLIGNISQILGDHHFMVRPSNDIYDYRPALPGTVGDFLYADNNGKITTTPTKKLLFIKLLDAIPTRIRGMNSNPTLLAGDKLNINGIEVDTGSNVDALVQNINNLNDPIYDATTVGGAVTAKSSANSLAYGIVGGYVPFSATINGVLVEFLDDSSGSSRYGVPVADEFDISNAITVTNIDNIESVVVGAELRITDPTGSGIIIENITNDTSGTPFAGSGSVTGMNLTTAPSTESRIVIRRLDGDQLNFKNVSGNSQDVVAALGIYALHNGSYPTVLYVEQGVRKGDTYVVDNDAQRNNLSVLPGDSAYVMDSGNGEWHYWLYSNAGWSLIATQDSARTDADTLSLIINYTESGRLTIGTVSDNSSVINVTVEVLQAFNGPAVINIGDDVDNSRIISDAIIDLSGKGRYINTPSHVYKTGIDTDLNAYFDPSGSTQGQLKVVITYA